MSRPVHARRAVCATTAVAFALLGGALLAPAAHAEEDEPVRLPGRVSDSQGVAPSKMTVVPPFGRKWQ